MNAKIYVVVGIITSLLLYAIEFFDRNEVVKAWLTAQENKAAAFGLGRAVAGFIVRPVIYMIDGPIGAVSRRYYLACRYLLAYLTALRYLMGIPRTGVY